MSDLEHQNLVETSQTGAMDLYETIDGNIGIS